MMQNRNILGYAKISNVSLGMLKISDMFWGTHVPVIHDIIVGTEQMLSPNLCSWKIQSTTWEQVTTSDELMSFMKPRTCSHSFKQASPYAVKFG